MPPPSSSTTSSSSRLPTLRDPEYGVLHFVALGYALAANLLGLYCLLAWRHEQQSSTTSLAGLCPLLLGLLASAHGRVIASYLVHEAAHGNIFRKPVVEANAAFGKAALILAGCPYADFAHVKQMHIAHHKDRGDTVEFDYRGFCRLPIVKHIVLALEFCYVPAVETVMHVRTAWAPLLWPSAFSTSRTWSSAVGIPIQLAWYAYLWKQGILLPHVVAGAMVLQYLALNDAFHHTFEAILMKDYVPGPGPRTAQYEEENTFSNLVSTEFPVWNLLSLNFGYHNAHHQRILTPWYDLPGLHDTLYPKATESSSSSKGVQQPQLLPFSSILEAFHVHRLRRVIEEDYGVVYPPDTPNRARDFVGSLGVSFLTV